MIDKLKNKKEMVQLADALIELFQKENFEYRASWDSVPLSYHNPITENTYRGRNDLLLFLHSLIRRTSDPRYMTFNQIKKERYMLKKGSKGIRLSFFNWYYPEQKRYLNDTETGNPKIMDSLIKQGKVVPNKRYFTVFNGEDVEGLPPFVEEIKHDTKVDEIFIQNLCDAIDLENHFKYQGRAIYSLTHDQIVLPKITQFKDESSFYGTFFHELTHATMAKERLNRPIKKKAIEELVAELGSIFLAYEFKKPLTDKELNSSMAYLQSWSMHLTDDDKRDGFIFAIENAIKATNYIRNAYDERKMGNFLEDMKSA